jgi:hypothetical protein
MPELRIQIEVDLSDYRSDFSDESLLQDLKADIRREVLKQASKTSEYKSLVNHATNVVMDRIDAMTSAVLPLTTPAEEN